MTRPAIGVIFHPACSPTLLPDYARRAEAAGFDELWLWDDSFLPGALTSAAVALAATERIRVGIGILPVTSQNPLFAAMEITTLTCLYPGRLIPGFGHGVAAWLAQIGAAPQSSLTAIEETVTVVRRLLAGESVTFYGKEVHLDQVQMQQVATVPPLLIGAMREKTLQLAGRVGDGAILTETSSPAYVRWAREQMNSPEKQLVVYTQARVNPDGKAARDAVRAVLMERMGWAEPHLRAAGLLEESRALVAQYGLEEAARRLPDWWIEQLTVCGTPEQSARAISALAEAGATSVVLQPGDGDSTTLDDYIRYLMPLLR